MSAEAPPATRDDVLACYRYVLGREPENDEVISRHLANRVTVPKLRDIFIRSSEFRMRHPGEPAPRLTLAHAALDVEVSSTPAELKAMLARIGQYWSRIGEEQPHWSVLTDERFRPAEIGQTRKQFYATGEVDRTLLLSFLARHGATPAELPRLMEYGCGVGRMTVALARDFASVTGCDISPAHLALGAEEAQARGIGDIAWFQSRAELPMPDQLCDVWFTRLVLQHNPPPIMAWLLREAFRRIAPGGFAVFQVPTHRIGYRFSVAEYLRQTAEPVMEMHVLPQPAVYALAKEAGLDTLEVREEGSLVSGVAGQGLSNIFIMRRPR